MRWLKKQFEALKRESAVPPPPFKASKRTGEILNGLWYGRLTPDEARSLAEEYGFPEDRVEEMVEQATQPPSYWSNHEPAQQEHAPDEPET